jgi:hypothetical protein
MPSPSSTIPRIWICCLTLCLTAPLCATAQVGTDTVATPARWQQIYTDENVTILLDAQTYRLQNDSVTRLWTDWRYVRLQRLQNGSEYQHVKALIEVNCSNREFRELRSVHLLRGSPVSEASRPRYDDAEWLEPIPDSLGEAVVYGVCFWLGR